MYQQLVRIAVEAGRVVPEIAGIGIHQIVHSGAVLPGDGLDDDHRMAHITVAAHVQEVSGLTGLVGGVHYGSQAVAGIRAGVLDELLYTGPRAGTPVTACRVGDAVPVPFPHRAAIGVHWDTACQQHLGSVILTVPAGPGIIRPFGVAGTGIGVGIGHRRLPVVGIGSRNRFRLGVSLCQALGQGSGVFVEEVRHGFDVGAGGIAP